MEQNLKRASFVTLTALQVLNEQPHVAIAAPQPDLMAHKLHLSQTHTGCVSSSDPAKKVTCRLEVQVLPLTQACPVPTSQRP
jgi:hypothetical protein